MALASVAKPALGPADGERGGLLCGERVAHGLGVAALGDGNQPPQLVGTLGDQVMLETIDQRPGDARRHSRHEVEPNRRTASA